MQSFLGQNLGKVIGLLKLDLGMQFSGMFAEVDGAELGQGPYKLGGDLFTGSTPATKVVATVLSPVATPS